MKIYASAGDTHTPGIANINCLRLIAYVGGVSWIALISKLLSRSKIANVHDAVDLQRSRSKLIDDENELNEVTTLLGSSYKKMKESEKEKNRLKEEFFRMIDNRVGEGEAFEYVNKTDGLVYSRQISNGAPLLDDERLREEDPELWDQITYIPEPERTLKPLDELDPELLAKVGSYLITGRVTTKLGAPRKAKPEELIG